MARTKITLSEPIILDGKTITEVVVRSPKVREVRELDRLARSGAADLDAAIASIVMLTDLSPEAAEELDAVDVQTLSGAIEGFFGAAPAPGNGGLSRQMSPTS